MKFDGVTCTWRRGERCMQSWRAFLHKGLPAAWQFQCFTNRFFYVADGISWQSCLLQGWGMEWSAVTLKWWCSSQVEKGRVESKMALQLCKPNSILTSNCLLQLWRSLLNCHNLRFNLIYIWLTVSKVRLIAKYLSATLSGVGGGDDEYGGDGTEIHTSPDKTAIMVGSIKCHIDYCPPWWEVCHIE